MSAIWPLIRLARPHHWIKNVFVLAPVPFVLADHTGTLDLPAFAAGVAGFCLVNSAVYAFNDLRDAAADREHPRTAGRPIAVGEVSPTAAAALAVALLAGGLALLVGSGAPRAALGVVGLYLTANAAYSLGAKQVALVDVFLLASGFVLRVFLGCALLSAPASSWLVLCTSALALLLGFGKRRADLGALTEAEAAPRRLAGYTPAFLGQAMSMCAAIALLSYALYCLSSPVLRPGRQMASMPFVAYAILDYLRLCEVGLHGGSPVELAYRSRSHQLCAVGWVIAILWGLGRIG